MSYNTITLRELVGDYLVELGKNDDRIYVIDSDLAKSTTTNKFEEAYPTRFVETGIAEQNAMSIATGIAAEGKIPFYVNFAIFASGTCWTQLRQACYANANVKVIATHPGMDGGFDGATHHANEDIALMRVLPNLHVLVPSNPKEFKEAIKIAVEIEGPVYIRCSRDVVPNIEYPSASVLGKAQIVADEGNDFAIIFEGSSANLAQKSFSQATEKGYKGKLINLFSLKPVDTELVIDVAQKVKKIVTIENHSVLGGVGSIVNETLSEISNTAPIYKVGIQDTFTESGPSDELKDKYGLNVESVLKHIG